MRSLLLAIHVAVLGQASTLVAQNVTATIRVEVRASERPVEGAEVVVAAERGLSASFDLSRVLRSLPDPTTNVGKSRF